MKSSLGTTEPGPLTCRCGPEGEPQALLLPMLAIDLKRRMPDQTPALKRSLHCDHFLAEFFTFISLHLNSFSSRIEMEERMYRS